MKTGVLIPSHGRDAKLRKCLDGLAAQDQPADEILVGLDGGDEQAARRLEADYAQPLRGTLRVLVLDKIGLIETRRRMIEETHAELFISLNDDVLPCPGLVAAHENAHERARERWGGTALVTGPAPWKPVEHPTLFDRLVAESDLIFFTPTPDADGRVGYRDCVGLNFSTPVHAVRETGGFHPMTNVYGYEDIELAHRLGQRFDAPVLYEPKASVTHDHRYTPEAVMHREYRLGRAAWAYANTAPGFCLDLFGRDITSPDELAFSRAYLVHARRDAERIERSFIGLGALAPDAAGTELLPTLAQHWTPLKRYLWRWGLLDASAGTADRYAPLTALGRPH